MSVVNLKWSVDKTPGTDLATLLADGYVEQRIDGGALELTGPTTRLPLVADCPQYVWQSPNGTVADPFKITYAKADGTLSPNTLLVTDKKVKGYCSIQDVRDEGYLNPPLTDAMVQRGIDMATAMIDRICRQWFDPRWHVIAMSGDRYPEMHLDVPIIALMTAQEWSDGKLNEINKGDLVIYNRHLTRGQTMPDDRANPMVTYDDCYIPDRFRRQALWDSRFVRGQRNIRLAGVFGYTEIGESDLVGETAVDSQVPLSFGSTPALIKRAATILAIDKAFPMGSGLAAPFTSAGTMKREKTRDQEYERFQPGSGGGASGDSGATGIPEVDAILASFMAPISIGGV